MDHQQACREIPCFGTTHADYFYGAVPLTDQLTDDESKGDYELNTGNVIIRRFAGIELLARHGKHCREQSHGRQPI
jgi:L-ribulose-5-phosphate 4-epimerase